MSENASDAAGEVTTAPDPLDPSATVPDVSVFFARWREWSDALRDDPRVTNDLRYGPSEDESLDLFVPREAAPLVAFFHGGYWRRLHKNDHTFVARGLAAHGVATAIVNYGLAPMLTLEEITAQARRSASWLRANAAVYGADPARFVVAGHSAGGHLAAMCAVDAPVGGVVTMSGLHELVAVARSFANAWLQLDDARAAALSPARLAPAAPVPVYAITGERETPEFRAQGRAIVDAWRARGCTATYEDAAGDDHFTLLERLHHADDPLVVRIAAMAHGR
ncbi:MAG TPA: alpha/beta hydrolase [Candidatus Baltobacteraceae bacterium]|nr:alpha/beta hydrolase [Candidatus Baltobacteraceae bacterium]